MKQKATALKRRWCAINWNAICRILLLVALCLPAAGVEAQSVVPLRTQESLLQLAASHPETTVRVIVQKQGQDNAVEALVTKLGGHVTRQLSIINAFVAELPASTVPQLATHPAVRWVSLDAPVVKSGGPDGVVNRLPLLNSYIQSINAHHLWDKGYQGSSVTVAVVDSGIAGNNDFKAEYGGNGSLRVLTTATIVNGADKEKDWYGHGTHVAGIVAGNGTLSGRRYIGVAPKAKLVAVDVSNEQGAATISDVVAGLQWIYNNKSTYNIRVVNLSLNSSVAESYHTSALSAACEILWFSGIVVVVSAGNNGSGADKGILYPPANDPFVITVGAVDDRATTDRSDDLLASFSAYGITADGFPKPELVAPGRNIISVLSKQDTALRVAHPSNSVYTFSGSQDFYFRMSGTSMATPIVAGTVALLLQDEPTLTPDQVKYRLMTTAPAVSLGTSTTHRYLDAYAAVYGKETKSANTGVPASQLLWTGSQPIAWNSVRWNSVNWNSVSWNTVSWNTVTWNTVSWNSDYWDDNIVGASAVIEENSSQPQEEEITTEQRVIFLPIIDN